MASIMTGVGDIYKASTDNVSTNLLTLSGAIQELSNKLSGTTPPNENSGPSEGPTMKSGGGVIRKFARGGYVPGSGNRDTVPAMLQPGEFVIRKKAVDTIGANQLHSMNKYGRGGIASKFRSGGKIQKFKQGGGVADVQFTEGYDGDSFHVNFTPAASPYETLTRLEGADAYEIKGAATRKGYDANEIAKGKQAAEITTRWAQTAGKDKLLKSFKDSNKYDNLGRPMFKSDELVGLLKGAGVLDPESKWNQKSLGGLIQKFARGGKAKKTEDSPPVRPPLNLPDIIPGTTPELEIAIADAKKRNSTYALTDRRDNIKSRLTQAYRGIIFPGLKPSTEKITDDTIISLYSEETSGYIKRSIKSLEADLKYIDMATKKPEQLKATKTRSISDMLDAIRAYQAFGLDSTLNEAAANNTLDAKLGSILTEEDKKRYAAIADKPLSFFAESLDDSMQFSMPKTLYAGLGQSKQKLLLDSAGIKINEEKDIQKLVGKTVSMPSFLSSSELESVGLSFSRTGLMKIATNPKRKGLNVNLAKEQTVNRDDMATRSSKNRLIDNESAFFSEDFADDMDIESEYIFPRNSKFKVLKTESSIWNRNKPPEDPWAINWDVQELAQGGKIQRKVGYIDYDVIANEANAAVVDAGMKQAGVSGPRLYADYLTDLAVKARKEESLDKLRAIYGVAGSGKTTLARGAGTDIGTMRQTERFPILSPEDIQKATEVLILTSTVSKDKLEGFLREVDRAYTLSSTTPEEQQRILSQRSSRDITGIGLEGRQPGATTGVGTDTAIGEALLGDALGKKSVVLGRTGTGRLRAKNKNELVDVIKKKIGFTWGGFAPTTRGHESIVDAAAAYGIPPEDFIALVGSNEGIRNTDPSSYRTAILDQDARVLLAKAGFGAKGATVLPKPRDFEVPQGFDISEGGRRRVLLPGAGSATFVADKGESDTAKYKAAGYNVVNIPRTEGISGTMVRDLIASGDMGRLQQVLSPGVYEMISNNIGRLQNRAGILPELIQQAKANEAASLQSVEEQIKAVGISRIDKKRAENDPEYAAQVEVLQQLRKHRDRIKNAAQFEPYRLLDRLAQAQPDKYALDFATRAATAAPKLGTMAGVEAMPQQSAQEKLIEEVTALGRVAGIKKLLDLPKADRSLDSLLRIDRIKTYQPDSPELQQAMDVVQKALNAQGTSSAAEQQRIAGLTKVGVVGLLDDSGQLGYSKNFEWDLDSGNKVYAYARGVSQRYEPAVRQMQAESAASAVKFAENMQYADIFTGEPLAFDFDETLVKGADILGPNGKPDIPRYGDLDAVAESLKGASLTSLGEKLRDLLRVNPDFKKNTRILTARPQQSAGLLAQSLQGFGLPYQSSDITGVSNFTGGNTLDIVDPNTQRLNSTRIATAKAQNLGALEKLIDDNLDNVMAAKKAGKKAYLYTEPAPKPELDLLMGQGAIEGAIVEKALALLGANLPPIEQLEQNRAIDFPGGLGRAAQFFDIDPNIPTEVKRTLNGSSFEKAREEFARMYSEQMVGLSGGGIIQKFRNGGQAEYIEKYKQILKSILPPEFLSDQGFLKTPSGRSEPIEIIPPTDVRQSSMEKMMSVLLGKPQKEKGGASYSGGLVYKILRDNLYQAKDKISPDEYNTLRSFVDQNLLFHGEDDIIDLEEQKRPGSFAHETFHDIQGYLLDYYPEIYKRLQGGVEGQRKNIEAWYSDPKTAQWRTARDYQLTHLFPSSYEESPYKSTAGAIVGAGYKKFKRFSPSIEDIAKQTQMDLGRAETIPVLMAAAAEGESSSQQILSQIFGSAGLNRDFYKSLPKFADGGVATLDQMSDKGLAKKSKEFGKIGLRNTGSEITATYFKNANREGMVTAKRFADNLFTVGLSKATGGYGPRLYDAVMEAATASGGMLTSDRNQVSDAAKAVWAYYFQNRGDVKKTPLDPSQWTKNQNYVDPKLYGKKETWPPFSDPAWILQTGYSKAPDLINSPDIIDMNDPKYADYIRQQQLGYMTSAVLAGNMRHSGGSIRKFAKGGTSEDTVPALLTPGEFVINKKAAQRIGYGQLNRLNKADKLQGFNKGGSVGITRFAAGGKAPGDQAAAVDVFVQKIVELTSAIESQTYKVRRSEGMTAQEAKKEADTEAQFAAIDFGRMQTYIDPANAKIIAEAVGRVLDSIVGKMSPFSEGGPRKPGYFDRPPVEKAPIPEPKQDYTGQRLTTGNFDPNDIVTPARIVEKFTLEAEAAGMTLDKLTDRIKKFTADTAIAYKQTVTKQQKSAGAAISTATDVRSDESIKRAQSEVTNLFQAFDSNIPEERMGQIMNQLESGIKSGMNFDQIKSSIPELDSIIREVIDNHKALAYATSETVKKFGTLTEQMKVSENLIKGVESGRWSGKSMTDIERLQTSSEKNIDWEKFGGNRFPGFDKLNQQSPELAANIGRWVEKLGGFVGVMGAQMLVFAKGLPSIYTGLDNLLKTSLSTNASMKGLANGIAEAGGAAKGFALLAQQAGLDAKGTAIAGGTGLVLGGIQGAFEGYFKQEAQNFAEALAATTDRLKTLYDQLKLPGIDAQTTEDIRSQIDDEIGRLSKEIGNINEITTPDWSTLFYNVAASIKDGIIAGLTFKAGIASFKSSGGVVGYYDDGGSIFKPKGTDTVPAMLTPGEFVVNKKSTAKNQGLLESINSGNYKARGGVVYAAGGGVTEEEQKYSKGFTRFMGALKALSGALEAASGTGLLVASGAGTVLSGGGAAPVSVPGMVAGGAVAAHGGDRFIAGMRQLFTGEQKRSITSQGLDYVTGDKGTSDVADEVLGVVGGVGSQIATKALEKAATTAVTTAAEQAAKSAVTNLPGSGTQVVGAGTTAAAATDAAAAATDAATTAANTATVGSIVKSIITKIGIGAAITGGFSMIASFMGRSPYSEKEQKAVTKIADLQEQYFKKAAETLVPLQGFEKAFNIVRGAKGLTGDARNQYFAGVSPVTEAATRTALTNQGFDIKNNQSIQDFVGSLDQASQANATAVVEQAKIDQIKNTLVADEIQRATANGDSREDAVARASKLIAPLQEFGTVAEAQAAALSDTDLAALLKRAMDVQGIQAQSIYMQYVMGQLSNRIQQSTDLTIVAMKRFEEGITKLSDKASNLSQVLIPNLVGNKMGGPTPTLKIDRSALITLNNLATASNEQIASAVEQVGSQMGMSSVGTQNFTRQFQAQRIVEQRLPQILAEISDSLSGAGDNEEPRKTAEDRLRTELKPLISNVMTPEETNATIDQLVKALQADNREQGGISRYTKDIPALQAVIKGAFESAGAFKRAGVKIADFGDTFYQIGNQYAEALTHLNELSTNYAKTLAESTISLKQALGESVSVDEGSRPFENMILGRTFGTAIPESDNPLLRQNRRGTTDPRVIGSRLDALDQEKIRLQNEIEAARGSRRAGNLGVGISKDAGGDLKALQTRLALVTSESDRLNGALKSLADSTQKASLILNKIQELQKVKEGKETNFLGLLKSFSNPEEMMRSAEKTASLAAFKSEGAGGQPGPIGDLATAVRLLPQALEAMETATSQMTESDKQAFRGDTIKSILSVFDRIAPDIGAQLRGLFSNQASSGAFGIGQDPRTADLIQQFLAEQGVRGAAAAEIERRMAQGAADIQNGMNAASQDFQAGVRESVLLEEKLRAEIAQAEKRSREEAQRMATIQSLGVVNSTGNVNATGPVTIGVVNVPNMPGPRPLNPRFGAQPAETNSRGGMVYASDGQHINFKPKGTDTVPAMLTPGEFVVNAKSTKQNLGLLKTINSGSKGYKSGGIVYLEEGGQAEDRIIQGATRSGPISFYNKVLGQDPSTQVMNGNTGPYNLSMRPRDKYAIGWGEDIIDPDSILGLNMKYEPDFGNDAEVKKHWKDKLKIARSLINSRLKSGQSVEGEPLLPINTSSFDKRLDEVPSIASSMDKAIGYKYLQSINQFRLSPSEMIDAEKINAKNSRDWAWTEGRDWVDYLGIPTNSESLAAWTYGLTSKIIPGILGVIGGGIGFAAGAPLGPGAILTGAGGGIAGAKLGEEINQVLYDNLLPSWLKTDIENKQKQFPKEYEGGKWVGFASELGGGAVYGRVIEQTTKRAIAATLMKGGNIGTRAATGTIVPESFGGHSYLGMTEEEFKQGVARLKAMTEQSINDGTQASTKVKAIHGGGVGYIEEQAQKAKTTMGEAVDTARNVRYVYGPGGDPYRPGQVGMGGFNLGVNSALDQMIYTKESYDEAIKAFISGKMKPEALRSVLNKSGFMITDLETAMLDDSLVKLMDNVRVEKPELFEKILGKLKDDGYSDVFSTLTDGTERKWYDTLNILRDKFKSLSLGDDALAEKAFQDFAQSVGIKGTRAQASVIRGGKVPGWLGEWLPPGQAELTGDSVALLTNKVLGDAKAVKLNEVTKFEAEFRRLLSLKNWGNEVLSDAERRALEKGYNEITGEGEKDPHNLANGGLIYASNGQYVNFKPKGTDTVPAMLTPGEFVVNRKATQNNLGLLKSINSGHYNKGGRVSYLQNGGMANSSGSIMNALSGVSLSVDSSSLNSAFSTFQEHVQSMKASLDSFGATIGDMKNGLFDTKSLNDAGIRLSTAAASIRNASDNFANNILQLNKTLSGLETSINAIPSEISLNVTGGIPVNVTVDVNGGEGLDNRLSSFKDEIYSAIENSISAATQGNLKIVLKRNIR